MFSDHEYIFIRDDIFDRTKSSHQDKNNMWKFISHEPNEIEYHSEETDTCDDRIQNKKGVLPKNQPIMLFRERGKKVLTIKKNHLITSGY